MEAEQLIQEKEWQSLTEAERDAVLPLAADEQEFNLLKKMLLVARAEMNEVPPVGATVHAGLHEAVAARKGRVVGLSWPAYAAAAVFLLAVLGALFLWKSGGKQNGTQAPGYVHVDQKKASPNTSSRVPAPETVVVAPSPSDTVMTGKLKTKGAELRTPAHHQAALVAINTSVAMNGSLLDVVAEAY